MRQEIATLSYSDVDFVWVSNHWDHHLNGLCKYKENLCEFKCDYDKNKVKIFKLSFYEKIKWLTRKKLFEWMVGDHWTYKNGVRGSNFGVRKPYWFFDLLFKLYYLPRRIKLYLTAKKIK